MADKIKFFDDDPDAVVTALKNKFEELSGRLVQPAQAEMLMFKTVGYRMGLILTQANETANKCFVLFADGAALDELGKPFGVTRQSAAPASCILRFTLIAGHGPLTVPAGIRVQSIDGKAVFATLQSKSVLEADTFVDIQAECIDEGIVGNGYDPGDISVILDPLAYVTDVVNTDLTANGGNAETDDELRERIFLAPDSFSVAGPKGAYKFHAKSAHPNIVDVAVTIGHEVLTPFAVIPGQVDIFPLMADGNPPDTEIQDAILAICNDEKVRPLTDTVIIKAPLKIDYSISVQLVLLPDAVQADVEALVTANLEAYRDARKNKLGIDVVLSQIIAAAQVAGVYKVTIVSPVADIEALENQFTNCTGITVTTTGTHDQ